MKRICVLLSVMIATICLSCIALGTPPDMGNGWYWPTDWGNNVIFGWLQWNSQFSGYHLGIDLRNDAHQAVYSIGDGEVISSGEHNGYGNYGDGTGGCVLARYQAADGTWFTAMYGHLDDYVGTGTVSAGQIIGYTIPDWSPPHLHFSIHPGYDARSSSDGKGPWRGYTPDSSNTMEFVEPISFLRSHPKTSPCDPAKVWWTSTPQSGWYNSNHQLGYDVSGTSPHILESPANMWISGLGQGRHDYSVHVWNDTGDVTIHWQGGWDTVLPSTNFSGPATSTWLPAHSSISWNPTDTNIDYVGYPNPTVVSTLASSSLTWDNGSAALTVPEGKHTVTVSATDSAGNNVTETHGPYWLDTVGPSVSLTGPTTSTWLKTAQTVTWDATDATSGVGSKSLTWDNGIVASGSPAGIPEGKRTATVTAKDVAGNPASQSYGPFWVDTVPPVVSVTLDPTSPNGENDWYTVEPTMRVSAVDPNGIDGSGLNGIFCSIDGVEQAFTSPVTVVRDGVHSCTGRATDTAGNCGMLPVEVKVDTTAPVFATIHTEAESGSLDTLAASWDCSDPNSGVAEYEYSIYRQAGDTDKLITGPMTTTEPYAQASNLALESGENYYFIVRAKNSAGLYSGYVTSDVILASDSTRDLAPSFNSGGVSVPEEARTSEHYMLVDTLGQFAVDTSSSNNFVLESGYWHSDLTTVDTETVALAKATEDNKLIQLGAPDKPVVVTVAPGVFDDRFYVEQPDRSSGIAVQFGYGLGMPLMAGERVWIIGTITTIDGERVIQCAAPTKLWNDLPLGALFVGNKWLGGSDLNDLTKGIDGGSGVNNLGMLIKTAGRIRQVDPNGQYFYIDDGSRLLDGTKTGSEDNIGVRIATDGKGYGSGDFVVVTGISSCFLDDGSIKRMIRPTSILPL